MGTVASLFASFQPGYDALIHQNQVEKVRRKLVEPSVLFPRNLLDVGDGDTAVPEVIQVDPTAFDDRHFGKFGRAFS